MDQTDFWMLGVGAFGVVFYLFALYYNKKGGSSSQEDDA